MAMILVRPIVISLAPIPVTVTLFSIITGETVVAGEKVTLIDLGAAITLTLGPIERTLIFTNWYTAPPEQRITPCSG